MKNKNENQLNATMLVIGDEILWGRTNDLNGHWLAKYLFQIGLHLKAIYFIGDNTEDIHRTLSTALIESDIVITSGGIGPTMDDKTKNSLASFFNKKMVERDDVELIVKKNYQQMGRPYEPKLNHYHFFPEDFTAVSNPNGYAPGILYFDQTKNKLILSAPGVPREFKAMVEQEFFSHIQKKFSNRFKQNFQVTIRTKEIPEEKIFHQLCPTLWSDLEKYGKVSSLPHTIGVDIVINLNCKSDQIEKLEAEIQHLILNSLLAPYVWQIGNKSLSEMIVQLAASKKITFSIAESCTGGLTASKITDISGSSLVFKGGIVAYSNQSKINLLQVSAQSIEQDGAVSLKVVEEMAMGCRKQFQSDYAISISGIAGPSGGTPLKPEGSVFIGFASKDKIGSKQFIFNGDRQRRKDRFSDMALIILLDLIKDEICT